MIILPYTKEFKSQIMEIFHKNTPKFFAKEEAGDFELFLIENASNYFILKSIGEVAGGGGFYKSGNTGYLAWNMLDPKFLGQGFGKALVNHCLDRMKANRNLSHIEVNTSQHAYKFYLKFGFRVKEHKKDFRDTGLDLYRMELPL